MSEEEKEEKSEKKSAAESLGDIFETFGSAVGEIFNDPKLKDTARKFGKSAGESAETFGSRFKDEDVKEKFRDVGKAAQDFGQSVADYFKSDKDKKKDEYSEPRTESLSHAATATGRVIGAKVDEFMNAKTGRITSSSMVIAWSVVLLIFFVFFSQYIAFYRLETVAGVSQWARYPVLTENFYAWLPIITVTLVVSIIGHSFSIVLDRYLLREAILIVLNVFGVWAVLTLLAIFPFDFSGLPIPNTAGIFSILVTLVLISVALGLGIATLVRFIKLVVSVSMRTTAY